MEKVINPRSTMPNSSDAPHTRESDDAVHEAADRITKAAISEAHRGEHANWTAVETLALHELGAISTPIPLTPSDEMVWDLWKSTNANCDSIKIIDNEKSKVLAFAAALNLMGGK